MTPSGASCSTSNSYAHLHDLGDRTENPGVGGSIPSLPTMIFPSDFDDLPPAPRRIFPRVSVVSCGILPVETHCESPKNCNAEEGASRSPAVLPSMRG